MAKDRKKLVHIHSNITDKQPRPEALEVGEIAVNNGISGNTDRSFLSIKNANNEVVRFSSDEQMISWTEKKEVIPFEGQVRGEDGPESTKDSGDYGSYGITNDDLLNNKSNLVIKFNQVAASNTPKSEIINGGKDIYGKLVNGTPDASKKGAGIAIDMSRYAMRGANPSFSSLTITNGTTLEGGLNVSGNTKIGNGLNVTGATNINGATKITGDTTFNGNETVNGNLTVTGDTNISGNTTIKGDTNISGNTTIDKNLTVNGDTNISGNTTLNKVTANTISASSISAVSISASNIYTKTEIDNKVQTMIDGAVSGYPNKAEYSSTDKNIYFKHNDTKLNSMTIDATDFIKDGLSKKLTWSLGTPSANTTGYNGSADATITIPSSLANLTDWNDGCLEIQGCVKASGFYQSSDRNLKENIIKPNSDKVSSANRVPILKFNYKNDESHRDVYGVVAQEVEANNLGELVYVDENGNKSVDYTSLMILKIAYLENENARLNQELFNLSKRLKKLEDKA